MAFTQESTRGYSDDELDALNTEWDEIVRAEGLQPETDEYYAREKEFCDQVSRR